MIVSNSGNSGDGRHHGDTTAAASVVIFAAVNHPNVVFRTLAIEADVRAARLPKWAS